MPILSLPLATALVHTPMGVLSVLALVVGGLFWLESRPATARLFAVLPALVWVYFLPMLATSVGILPATFPEDAPDLYDGLVRYVLPGALLVLIACSDLRSIGRAGPPALIMFLAGSLGIVVGGVVALALFQSKLPDEAWRGFGALAGSWIGGGVNLATLKTLFETPDTLLGQMLVLDTVIGYCWVGLLISWARHQNRFDRLLRARTDYFTAARRRLGEGGGPEGGRAPSLAEVTGLVALALGGGQACMFLGRCLPEVEGMVNGSGWGILILSLVGISLSFTRVGRMAVWGGDKLAYAGIYLMLAAFGAQADLVRVADNPALFLAGLVWMGVHVMVMFGVARLIRAPLFFLAVGSTANIGGPASAPLVAQVYRPDLASMGILLAVLGNTVGYYLGWICGQLCRLVAGGSA